MLTGLPGGKGRPRVPTAIKEQTGTLAHAGRPQNKEEPKPKLYKIGEPPEDADDHTRAAWKELREVITPLRTMTRADLVAFNAAVDSLAIMKQARAEVREHGITISGGNIERAHPAVTVLFQAQKLVAHWLARFGATPADRSRVTGADSGTDGSNPENEFA